MGINSDVASFLVQVIIVLAGVCIGNLITFKLVWPRVELRQLKLNGIRYSRERDREFLQMSFGAYERLLLLSQRMEPQQVMLRQHQPGMVLSSFLKNIVFDVENEYQHNVAQQLYVTDIAWSAVTQLKVDTTNLFNNVARGLPANATIDDFVGVVLAHVKSLEKDPYHGMRALLKSEMSR